MAVAGFLSSYLSGSLPYMSDVFCLFGCFCCYCCLVVFVICFYFGVVVFLYVEVGEGVGARRSYVIERTNGARRRRIDNLWWTYMPMLHNWCKRKEMFYLTTHSTFYLRLYGVGQMVKNHSDYERGNPLPPHGLLLPISSKGSFICTIPQTG